MNPMQQGNVILQPVYEQELESDNVVDFDEQNLTKIDVVDVAKESHFMEDVSATIQCYGVKQRINSSPIGTILVRKGLMSQAQLQAALANQGIKLGEIFLKRGWLTPSELQRVLAEQARRNNLLGELCVEEQIISREQLERALKEQYWRRNGFWVID